MQSLDKTLTGTVARFADRLDTDTRTMHVEVDVPNPTLELVPGMYADASIALDQANGVLVAPVQARRSHRRGAAGRSSSTDADRIEARDGRRSASRRADRVEVRAGLQADDLVVRRQPRAAEGRDDRGRRKVMPATPDGVTR